MEIQPVKKARVSHIDDTGKIFPSIAFSEKDEQCAAISKMWSRETQDDKKGEDDTKSIVMTNLGKAVAELNMTLNLISMIKGNDFFSPIKCARQSIRQKNITLPTSQKISIHKTLLGNTQQIISRGINSSKEVATARQRFAEDCLGLRKHWRLLLRSSSGSGAPRIPGRPISISYKDSVSIDCSFISAGDMYSGDDATVPLSMGINGAEILPQELLRPLYTLQISLLVMVKDKGWASLSSTSAYEVHHMDTNNDVIDPFYSLQHQHQQPPSTSNINHISKYCVRRQHDVLCRRIFLLLRHEATQSNSSSSSCCWTTASSSSSFSSSHTYSKPSSTRPSTTSTSTSTPFQNDNDNETETDNTVWEYFMSLLLLLPGTPGTKEGEGEGGGDGGNDVWSSLSSSPQYHNQS
eukprot:gene3792-7534_t